MDEYTKKKLEKIDEISDAVIYIKGKMEIIDQYGADIRENAKDINNLGKKVRVIESSMDNIKDDLGEIKKKTICQDEDIRLIGDKNTNFWIKVLIGSVSFLAGIIGLLVRRFGII